MSAALPASGAGSGRAAGAGAAPGAGSRGGPARRCVVRSVHLGTVLLCAGAVLWTVHAGIREPGVAVAFGAFVAIGESIRMTLPGDRTTAPLGAAGALAYAVLGDVEGVPTSHGVLQVVALVTAAMAAGLLPHLLFGRRADPDLAVRRILTVAFAATLFQPLFNGGRLRATVGETPLFIGYMAALLALAALCDAVLAAALTAARAGWRFLPFLGDELRARMGIGSAIAATGVVMAVAAGVMGLWALPVFSVPLLLTQFSFRRYAAIRATYRQTIASLARATEVAGYTRPGHAHRVARLSVETGRRLGMGERDLLLLEYAALMHDIGQLSLVDPVPGGATAVLDAGEQRRIARLGGEVVRQTGVPPEVAVIVERQADPFLGADGVRGREHPLASSIVRAANAYDDLLADGGGLAGRLATVERLRLATAREYEPGVVEALAEVCLGNTRSTRR